VDFIKKISAFLLLSIYLIAATETTELLKLPLLVEHYYHHKSENIHTRLISFLKMHYETGKGTNKNAKENNRLPFKSAHHSADLSFISLVPPLISPCLTKRVIIKNKPFEIPNHFQLPSKYLALIWQPPRNC
jgi:hypothetical protein